MTRNEIVEMVSSATGIEKTLCKTVFDSAVDIIATQTSQGNTIYIRGLFTIFPKLRREKKAQIIRKRQTITMPAHYIPFAKFSKTIMQKNVPVS